MKCLVLFSLIACSVALPNLLGRYITVSEDGCVKITNSKGLEVNVVRAVVDPKKVDIIITSPYVPARVLQIDEVNTNREISSLNFFTKRRYQGLDQADVLADIFRQYEGAVTNQRYDTVLNRIQLLVEAGVINQPIYDILRNCELEHYVHKVRNMEEDLLNAYSPLPDLQVLLNQIREKYRLQQELYEQCQHLPEQYGIHENLLNRDIDNMQHLHRIYSEQLEQIRTNPLNGYLVNLRTVNGKEMYKVPEQFIDVQSLQEIYDNQERLYQLVDMLIAEGKPVPEQLVPQQLMINQQIDKISDKLVFHQNLISRQVKQYLQQKHVVPRELLYQQRMVYQQVHQLIEHLSYQQLYIVSRMQYLTQHNQVYTEKWILQHKNVYTQIQRLIQHMFLQQINLKDQIQLLVQNNQVVPQELIVFQRMTYQQVEMFIQVLLRQFINQQALLKQIVQFYVEQGRDVPQEVVSHYFMIYRELLQLIQQGDVVPQDLINEVNMLHQEIIMLLQQRNMGQLVDSRQKLNVQQPEYQREYVY